MTEYERQVAGMEGIARALRDLGNGNAATDKGAVEAHSMKVAESLDGIAAALHRVADAIEGLSEVTGHDRPGGEE